MSALIILYILLAILLLVLALCLLRIHFDIICNGETTVKLRILCIKFTLYPKTKNRVSAIKFKNGYPKEKKPKQKDTVKEKKTAKEKTPVGDMITGVITLVKILCSKFFKHLRLDVSKILVTVGGSDAAATAITYGVVSQSVAYLLEFLDQHLTISKKRKGEINVLCDFTTESTIFDINISASLAVWQILDIGITLAYNYFKGKDIFNILNS